MTTPRQNSVEYHREAAFKALDKRAGQALRDAKVRERLDAPFAILLGAGLLVLMALGYAGSVAIDRAGLFDPDIVRPLPDARILTNLRDSDAPFIAGAALADGEGPVVLLRDDGQLAQFNEVTGLLSHSRIDVGDVGLNSPLVMMSAGCGRERVSEGAVPCPASDHIYAVSRDGGIIQSDTGADWRIRLRDTPWIGRDGQPVQQADVTSWASSADGRYIAALAGAQGLAIFDQQFDKWAQVGSIDRLMLDEVLGAPVHVLAHDGDFWIGTVRGLARIAPDTRSPRLEWSDDTDMSVHDLDVTADGDLIALLSGACLDNIGNDCLSIETVGDINQRRVLVGEVEKIATLSDDTIRHAILQGDNIVVVDRAGLFIYDQNRRTWRTLAAGTVDAFWVGAQNRDITATMADVLVSVSGGAVASRRDLEGAPFTQIEVTSQGRILGLASDGNLRDLSTDQILSSREGAPPTGAVFHAGASLEDVVVMASGAGLLVHDVRERRFWWQDASALDPAATQLTNRATELRTGGGLMWLINRHSGAISSVSVGGDFPDITVIVSDPVFVDAPMRSVMTAQTGLFIVNNQGVPVVVKTSNTVPHIESLVGAPRSARSTFTTAALHSEGQVFATATQIWDYQRQTRNWLPPMNAPTGERISDLSIGDDLFALTESGRIYSAGEQAWSTVLDGGARAQLGLSDVTDAISTGSTLFLAGRGVVQTYDLNASAFGATYSGGQGDVRLVDVVANRPVWMSNARLRYGNDMMVNAPVLGAWLAQDGVVALLNGAFDTRFVMHWRTPTSDPVCTFRTAQPPQGEVIDAVKLSENRLLVATHSDIAIYHTLQRRWLSVTGLTPTPDLRVYVTGGHLVAVTDARILSMSLADIPDPESCTSPDLALNWTVDERGQNVAYDADRGQVMILYGDGRVSRWAKGALALGLAAPNEGPARASLQQAIANDGRMIFAASDRIWQYDLGTRLWMQTRLAMPDGAAPIHEVDLTEQRQGRADVTVWTQDNTSYVGTWLPTSERIDMVQVAAPRLAPIATVAGDILDISTQGEDWIVASQAGLEFTRRGRANPLGTLTFPLGVPLSQVTSRIGDNTVFTVGETGPPDRLFILPVNTTLSDQRGSLTAASYDYSIGSDRAWGISEDGRTLWRIENDGAVVSCLILAGGQAPAGCVSVLAAPLQVASDSVGLVFDAANQTYAVIDGALTAFDATRRIQTPINGPKPREDAVPFRFDEALFVWDGVGQDLWRIEGMNAQLVLSGVRRIKTEGDALMLDQASDIYQLPRGAIAPKNLTQASPLGALSYDWVQGGGLIGVDDAGLVRSVSSDLVFPVPLPRPETINRVLVTGNARIWVQRGDGSVTGYLATDCTQRSGPRRIFGVCLAEIAGARFANPKGDAMLSVFNGATPSITFSTFSISFDGSAFGAERTTTSPIKLTGILPNDSTLFQSQIIVGPIGAPELAPAVLDNRGVITSGVGGIATKVLQTINNFNALDLGWLAWDRSTGAFNVAGVNRTRTTIRAQQFIRDGRSVLDHDGVARGFDGGAGFQWVTPHSIWQFETGRADPVLLAMIDLPDPVGLEAGRVLFSENQGLAQGALVLDTDANGMRTASGALAVQSDWRARSVQAQITRSDNSQSDAFGARGFSHDQRNLVGWMPTGPVLSSAVGLLPVSGFQSILPNPESTPQDRIVQLNGQGFAERGADWLSYDESATAWSSASDPYARRVLADMNGVVWRRDQNSLDISVSDAAQTAVLQRTGLQFEGDRLRALSATPSAVLIATGLGTHQYANAGNLSQRKIPDDPAVPSNTFDALTVRPNDWVLFAGKGGAVWDDVARVWAPPDAQRAPWQDRRVIDTPLVQLDLSMQRGSVARRTVRHIDGSDRFAQFNWSRNDVMPFDRANAIFASGTVLYVGTNMGLRIMGVAPARSDILVDAATSTPRDDRPVEPAMRVGRPASDPMRIVARDRAGACLEITSPTSFASCTDPAVIDRIFIAADELWNWNKTATGLSGEYVLAQGQNRPIPNNPNPRWPHDTLIVHGTCAGHQIEVWEDGVTLHEAGKTDVLDGAPRVAVHCQSRDVQLASNVILQDGLYLLSNGQDDTLVHTAPSTWTSVEQDISRAIAERAVETWAYEATRLRLRARGAVSDIYEYRPIDGQWATMPWAHGLPAMDETRAVLSDGATTLRVTPVGIVEQSLTASALQIDPDQVVFRTTANPTDFASCLPDRAVHLDGRAHTFTKQTGAPVVLRCRDGQIVQEDPRFQGDVGAFSRTDQDPFAQRRAIDQRNGWLWAMDDQTPGSDPAVTITYRQEAVSLAAGRFDLDDYRSFAAPFDDRISMVAGLGLWAYPATNLSVQAGQRPTDIPDFASVSAVTADRDQTSGAPVLCVNRRDNPPIAYTADATPRQVNACYDWRGQDALFQYRYQADAGAQALAIAANGPLMSRKILDGQFSDRVAIAAPQPVQGTNVLLVPTALGASLLDSAGQTSALYSHADILAVTSLPDRGPSLLTRSGVFALDDALNDTDLCTSLPNTLRQIPEDVTLTTVTTRGLNLIHLRGTAPDGPFLASVRCDDDRLLVLSQEFVVDGRIRHVSVLRALPDATQAVLVQQMRDGSVVITDGRSRTLPLPSVAGGLIGVYAASHPRAAVILTEQDAYLLDIDAAISALGDAVPADISELALANDPDAPLDPVEEAIRAADAPTGTTDNEPRPQIRQSVGAPAQDPTTPAPPSEPVPPQPDPIPQSLPLFAPLDLPDTTVVNGQTVVNLGTANRETAADVQVRLLALGLYEGEIDGVAGPLTRAAISAFQRRIGTPQTGYLLVPEYLQLIGGDR